MHVHLCGVRGSTPAPGHEFAEHGGHTSCLAVAHADGPPVLLLDTGTGVRRVTALLEGAPFRGTILYSHLHWDHTQGLPFFGAGDNPDSEVRLLIPEQGDALEVLARWMSPPHFPIDPTQLRGSWTFGGLEPGVHEFEGFTVLARDIPHSAGRTFGYRVSDGHSAIAYMPDHGPLAALGAGPDGLGPYHEAALELVDGVDALFHDSQHTAEELPPVAFLGHSAAEYAVGLGIAAGARKVVLFHHEPSRTDREVDAMVARFADTAIEVVGAREGDILRLG